MAEAAAIRKQVTDLRPDDLAPYPIWEFALDEEGEEGQDEETVKPRPDLDRADPAEGISSFGPSSSRPMERVSTATRHRTKTLISFTPSRRS